MMTNTSTFLTHLFRWRTSFNSKDVMDRQGYSSKMTNSATHEHPKDETQLELCFDLTERATSDNSPGKDQGGGPNVYTPWIRFNEALNTTEDKHPELWEKVICQGKKLELNTTPSSSAGSTPTASHNSVL